MDEIPATHTKSIWHAWPVWLAVFASAVFAAFVVFGWTPAPGYAVALLGAVAAAMSLTGEMTHGQKAACMVAIAALLVIEIHAIKHDRDESAKAQHDARQEEIAGFSSVATSLAKTGSQFDAIQKRFDESATKSSDNQNESRRKFDAVLNGYRNTLNNITGGDSYAYVAVQEHAATADGVPLAVRNAGEHILTGVTVQIIRTASPPNEWDVDSGPQITVGTLFPGQIRMIGARIKPIPSDNGIDHYWVFIAAQNGLVSQMIYFRPRKDSVHLPWAFKSHVDRITFFGKERANSMTTPLRWQPWTDEPKSQRQAFGR
jgi:hypothetical protein